MTRARAGAVFAEQLDANTFADRPEQVALYTVALVEASRLAGDDERSRQLVEAALGALR